MLLDAIVLAGGRSLRLGGVDKTALVYRGQTLLDRAVAAASAARTVVVVGATQRTEPTRRQALFVREEPPFGGPVAGIAAGLAAVATTQATPSDATLVIAGDLAYPQEAVAELLEVVRRSDGVEPACDGFVAVDGNRRRQYLLACYRTDALICVLAGFPRGGREVSMRALTADLRLEQVLLSAGLADDVDTWDDAARIGVTGSAGSQ